MAAEGFLERLQGKYRLKHAADAHYHGITYALRGQSIDMVFPQKRERCRGGNSELQRLLHSLFAESTLKTKVDKK
ncbi:hypothetical protein QUF61_13300 [Candidatus Venteria ishoeyi]|nr:hypothetical protein [Candidatus Venteria ishoeyi]